LADTLTSHICRVPSEISQAKQEATVWRGRLSQFSELPVTEARKFYTYLYLLVLIRTSLTILLISLQMATYAGFVAEVYAWFAIGEIIGRGGSISGYSV